MLVGTTARPFLPPIDVVNERCAKLDGVLNVHNITSIQAMMPSHHQGTEMSISLSERKDSFPRGHVQGAVHLCLHPVLHFLTALNTISEYEIVIFQWPTKYVTQL